MRALMQKTLAKNVTTPVKVGLLVATTLASAMALVGCDNGKASTPTHATPTKTQTTAEKTAELPMQASNTQSAMQTSTTPANATNNTALLQTLSQNMAKSGINAKITSITPTEMPMMYWVKAQGMPPFLTDSTGQYVFQGEVVKVGTAQPTSITRDLLANEAKVALAKVDKKDMIIFPATGTTKAFIYVFTDADCGYCRKLHSQIKDINALGIEVRYLPWPRSEETFPIMEKIWCSKDRNAALTKAKNGETIDAPQCDNPVAKLHDLGLDLGVSGTPAIFTADGHQIGGYLPPDELAKALKIQ